MSLCGTIHALASERGWSFGRMAVQFELWTPQLTAHFARVSGCWLQRDKQHELTLICLNAALPFVGFTSWPRLCRLGECFNVMHCRGQIEFIYFGPPPSLWLWMTRSLSLYIFFKEFCLQISHVANDGHPHVHTKILKNYLKLWQSKLKNKVWSQTASENPISPLSVHIQNAFIITVSYPQTRPFSPLPHLHVSLIRVCVYSLEDLLPTEMAGCVIKSLTLGATQNLTICIKKKRDVLELFICGDTISVKVLSHVGLFLELLGLLLPSDANARDLPKVWYFQKCCP